MSTILAEYEHLETGGRRHFAVHEPPPEIIEEACIKRTNPLAAGFVSEDMKPPSFRETIEVETRPGWRFVRRVT